MRTRLTPSLLHRGMTLVEVVVVIGIISIALPALFSTLIVSTRQQVSISRINEVKNQGDSVLGVMTSRIKNSANRLCVTSAADTSCVTEVCGSTTASPTDMNSFIDRASVLTRYYLRGTSIYESTGGTEKRLTNDLVKVNSLVIQCHKTSQTTRPIISIQYTVIAEPIGNTNVSERATLDYSTKIIVDQVDPIAQSVSDIAPGELAVSTPTPTLTPSHSPTPSNTPTPTPTIPPASGGTITIENGYKIHTFTTSGTFTSTQSGNVEVLVVAGGGGSGQNGGGGGGAGGLIYNSSYAVVGGSNYTVTVGAGGAGASNSFVTGSSGNNSVFATLTAVGGGGGASRDGGGGAQSGGSGGGGGGGGAPKSTAGTSSATGQGNNGGGGYDSGGSSAGGGGGGCGSAGTTGGSTQGGNGGNGYWSSISGALTGYCGGGAGSGLDYNGYGGKAGTVQAGAGGGGPQNSSRNGRPNSGGGGGGLGTGLNSGDSGSAAGGSGIVIIRYPYNPTVYHPIAGHVTNAASGAVISGVSLIVEYTPSGATSTSTATVVTDAAGYYSLGNTVPIDTLYSVRVKILENSYAGKEGYSSPQLTAPSERIYGTINLYHTFRRDTPQPRDSQTTDASYERQRAGQSDCASAIASGWNYPAGRCDFRLAAIVVPTPTPVHQYWYYQTFLSRDGSNKYSRSCPINTSTGIVFASCSLLTPESITNLRGTGNERYSDWASTVYTLPNDAYDAPDNSGVTPALLPAGTQILITTLLATDGTSTYTRSCPLLPNSTSRCWPRGWAATTAAMYNLGTANFGDGAGKSYAGIDFVAYPRVFNGQLRQAFRRWFVRSDEKTYVAQQCYIRTSISNISDPISWTTECMNDSGAVNVFIIRDRTTETTSGFPEFHAAHIGVPTLSSIVYPKGSGYELLQMGLNSEGDWTWNRNAVVDPYTTGSSGFIFASPAVLNNVSTLDATGLNMLLRGVDGYVIKY